MEYDEVEYTRPLDQKLFPSATPPALSKPVTQPSEVVAPTIAPAIPEKTGPVMTWANVPIVKASGGAGSIGSAVGAAVGALGGPVGSVVGSAVGGVAGGIIDWIMGDDAAAQQAAQAERINRQNLKLYNAEVKRDESHWQATFALQKRQADEATMINNWKMRNADVDRRITQGSTFLANLSNVMNGNINYRNATLNARRTA